MRGFVMVGAVVAVGLGMWGCGGGYSSGSSGNPMSPTPSTAAGVVTINVVAINGALVWHNVDNVTHHVLLNDGSVDTGDLLPGASSRPTPVEGGGGPYHCAIHPVMVGSINQSAGSQQPCTGAYCQ